MCNQYLLATACQPSELQGGLKIRTYNIIAYMDMQIRSDQIILHLMHGHGMYMSRQSAGLSLATKECAYTKQHHTTPDYSVELIEGAGCLLHTFGDCHHYKVSLMHLQRVKYFY